MKKFLLFISLFIILIGICYGQSDRSCEDLAKEFVDLLAKENFIQAETCFDSTVKGLMPADKLQGAWKEIVAETGPLKKQTAIRKEKKSEYDVIYVTCEFEKTSLDIQIVFNNKKEISGLWFLPPGTSLEYKIPAYVKPDSFTEKEVTVGSGEWALPGTLTIPKVTGSVPAVILVHGSGPNDRDETVGANKPFRDLAFGLASRGIATLRYEKRTKTYGEKMVSMKELTVKEETIDDVLEGLKLLQNTEGIDSDKIFILGHSLGGTLIPKIALLTPDAAGFIILAGTTLPLDDKILEQINYIYSLDGNISDDEKVKLDEVKRIVEKIKALNENSPDELLYGVYPKYWLDLRKYNILETAKQIKRPLLILQGERDYQVTMKDFKLWESGLAGQKNVEFKTYPLLNHLFIEGEGKSSPDEYMFGGNIPEYIIKDISEWIKNGK